MKRFVQGEDRTQSFLLPEALDDYVTDTNPVRVVDVFVDELDLHKLGFEGVEPALTGRPSYHPGVMLKIYIYGYLNRIQSSRRLEREAQRNVELMWLTSRLAPDFKTIARFRKDNGKAIRSVCRQFVVLCQRLDLFTEAFVAIDGSKFKAVNHRDRNFTSAKLERRMRDIESSIARYLEAMDTADRQEPAIAKARTERLQDKIAALKEQMRSLKEIEVKLKEAPDGQISLTDPDARSMKTRGTGVVGYNVQTAVDTKHHLIVAHVVTNNGIDRDQLTSMAKLGATGRISCRCARRNPAVAALAEARRDITLDAAHIADASERLQRFAPLLADRFADVREAGGIIESPLTEVPAFAQALSQRYDVETPQRLLLKQDSHLPISGSIKARGGIYEVLFHAEQLAMRHGLLKEGDDYRVLASDACRALFREHSIAVGSTGNLGMSIGIASATLGFTTTVHMSADARQWKKDRLRAHGVTVVEYAGDYGEAIENGRRLAGNDPMCHFVDDENSTTLFLGYAVAGERLKRQLEAANVRVDAAHPLFVYLPCGVGGGPGGVAFGLKLAFGDAVHCFFAEPTHSPCMLMGVLTGLHEQLAVQDFGIDNVTAADGLAVGRPSGFVGRAMQRMIDGYYTVEDNELYAMLALMAQTQDIRLEPSALAGAPGFARVSKEQGYRSRMNLDDAVMRDATHVIWATGGGMVPEAETSAYLQTGRQALDGA